jgi:hypothetical protein
VDSGTIASSNGSKMSRGCLSLQLLLAIIGPRFACHKDFFLLFLEKKFAENFFSLLKIPR